MAFTKKASAYLLDNKTRDGLSMYICVSGILVELVDLIVVCLLCVLCEKNIYRRASMIVFVMIVCIVLYLRGDRVKYLITESLRATESTVDDQILYLGSIDNWFPVVLTNDQYLTIFIH